MEKLLKNIYPGGGVKIQKEGQGKRGAEGKEERGVGMSKTHCVHM